MPREHGQSEPITGSDEQVDAYLSKPAPEDTKRMAEETEDPWKHRSKGMVCATCMWCVMKGPFTKPHANHLETIPIKPILGRCRKHAPTMNGYPAVFENDWCGDHKLDENKL